MKHFQHSEFDSPDQPGSGTLMDEHFLAVLDNMREQAGIPFAINSGYRTQAHNMKVGSTPNSAHTRGMAADIQATTSRERYLIIAAAMLNGIKRIGVGKTFVHIDIDTTLPWPCIWVY